MPNLLHNLRIGSVAFVDRPADPHARMAIWKRDSSTSTDEADATQTPEEGVMPDNPLTEKVREGLSEDVVKAIDALVEENASLREQVEKAADAPETTPEDTSADVTKRDDLPDDVKEAIAKRDAEIEELRKSADSANKAVEEEIRKREEREWKSRIAKFDGVLPDEAPAKFRALAKFDSDLAEEVVKALEALSEQVDKSALYGQRGIDGIPEPTDAEQAMEAKAAEIAKRDNVDEVEAFAKAAQENPDLYERHLAEKGA